jgi:hypothetical protein
MIVQLVVVCGVALRRVVESSDFPGAYVSRVPEMKEWLHLAIFIIG